jgi:hypothetical protein
MEKRTMLAFLLFCLLTLPTVPASRPLESPPPELIAAPLGVLGATASAHPDEVDYLVLPDGTPLRVKVLKRFSSEKAKVGDVIDFAVAFEVRADGVVVIPQQTVFTGKVVYVSRPRRAARDGQVKVVYDALTLPTGETATVRPVLKAPNKGAKAAENAASATGEAAGVFFTAGITLFALPFIKGDEQVIPEGTLEVVYLNGPLRISRKAAMALQPVPASGYAYIYISQDSRFRSRDHRPSKLFCGEKLLNDSSIDSSYGELRLELPPGTYWFSTENQKDRPARIDLLASHEYAIWRNRQGLFAKELQSKKSRVYYTGRFVDVDLTKLTPEEHRSLTAEPAIKGND